MLRWMFFLMRSNNAEKCEQLRLEYAALLDQSRVAQEDEGRMRQLRQKNRELTQELERLRLQVARTHQLRYFTLKKKILA